MTTNTPEASESPLFPIRKLRPTDVAYIADSWVRSCRSQYPISEMPAKVIKKFGERVCALVSVAEVLIAHDPQNDDVIYGFICYEKGLFLGQNTPTLHYIYTRRDFRKLGIASALFQAAFKDEQAPIAYTQLTRSIKNASLKEKWNLGDFDPYLIEGALFRESHSIDTRAIYWQHIPCSLDPASRP